MYKKYICKCKPEFQIHRAYCGFIDICRMPVFMDFVVDLIHKFKCSLKVQFLITSCFRRFNGHKFTYPLKLIFTKSKKIHTHEYQWNCSSTSTTHDVQLNCKQVTAAVLTNPFYAIHLFHQYYNYHVVFHILNFLSFSKFWLFTWPCPSIINIFKLLN